MNSRIRTPNWYVVSGAPSSGITTLVSALRPYVDKTFPEAARALIDRNLEKGISVARTRADEGAFQRKVLRIKLLREARARKDRVYVFERGVPDSIPYFIIAGLDPGPVETYSRNRYKLVFYLEPLEYKKDYARTESKKTRNRLSRLLLSAYRDLGYKVIRVPAVPIEKRVRIVLSILQADAAFRRASRSRHPVRSP
jgi:predicted ATPase